MLTIFCFLSVIKLTNLYTGNRQDKWPPRAAKKPGTPETKPPVVPKMQSEIRQLNNPLPRSLSVPRVLPTSQAPAHRRGWAHATSTCQMNPGPCSESVRQCNPLQAAFWDHTWRWRKSGWAASQEYSPSAKGVPFLLLFVLCGTQQPKKQHAEGQHQRIFPEGFYVEQHDHMAPATHILNEHLLTRWAHRQYKTPNRD